MTVPIRASANTTRGSPTSRCSLPCFSVPSGALRGATEFAARNGFFFLLRTPSSIAAVKGTRLGLGQVAQNAVNKIMEDRNMSSSSMGNGKRQAESASAPLWLPPGVDFDSLPRAVQQVVVNVLNPAHQTLVLDSDDVLEQGEGLT